MNALLTSFCYTPCMKRPMPESEEEIKKMLTPEEYAVLREKGTEAPFSGEYVNEKADGTYECKVCGNPLFNSDAKFDSGTGWPSFDQAIPGAVTFKEDNEHGTRPTSQSRSSVGQVRRTEITCTNCGAHLGHVFDDGPTDTGKRFCTNSCSLDFKAE